MTEQQLLLWIEPLLTQSLRWEVVGTAEGIRKKTNLRDKEDKSVEYLNLVTALAANYGKAFHSGDYHSAAAWLGMPEDMASVLIRAGDNNLPAGHEHSATMTRLVNYLTNGGTL